jgi:hypothetical protein
MRLERSPRANGGDGLDLPEEGTVAFAPGSAATIYAGRRPTGKRFPYLERSSRTPEFKVGYGICGFEPQGFEGPYQK